MHENTERDKYKQWYESELKQKEELKKQVEELEKENERANKVYKIIAYQRDGLLCERDTLRQRVKAYESGKWCANEQHKHLQKRVAELEKEAQVTFSAEYGFQLERENKHLKAIVEKATRLAQQPTYTMLGAEMLLHDITKALATLGKPKECYCVDEHTGKCAYCQPCQTCAGSRIMNVDSYASGMKVPCPDCGMS